MTDVTASCPPAPVVTDRSFFAQPPICVEGFNDLRFEKGMLWAGMGVEAVELLKSMNICMNETSDWIEAEKVNRGLKDE